MNKKYDKVNDETYEKIVKIMKEMDYEPNFTAKSLSTGKSKLISVIIPVGSDYINVKENPFYFEFFLGVESIAAKKGYDIILSGMLKENGYRELIKKRGIDGIIVVGKFDDFVYNELEEIGIPVISIDHYQDIVKNSKNICSDNYMGGVLAAEEFLINGHKKIGVISGPIHFSGICKERFEGFKNRLEQNNIKIDKENIIIEEVSYSGGMIAGEEAIKKDVTGFFISADIMAFGVMKILQKNKKNIPEDFSIIGFDDVMTSLFINPSLTTIKQEVLKKGEKAAEVVIDLIKRKNEKNENIKMEVTIVKRDSVRKIDDK